MHLNFDLVVDQNIRGRIYPALARWPAEPYTQAWREFEQHWPYTVPLRLQEYCDWHHASMTLHSVDEYPLGSLYSIALGWFGFEIDYFELLPDTVFDAVQSGQLRIVFYYHEGDNPAAIKARLDSLAEYWKLPTQCYVFVSGNSAARHLPQFVYFADFELWYWQRNRTQPALRFNPEARSRDFSVLVRLHRDWRMLAMADLYQQGTLSNSYWSYCETGDFDPANCPIEIDTVDVNITEFQQQLPVYADNLSQDERNNHSHLEAKYYEDAYFSIVLETHFDADGSGGAFVTEKTFKPIKHAQPFFIAGPAGSLQVLRDLGYRTFDSVLDNSYDTIQDNTQRWLALRASIESARARGLHDLAQQCRRDCEHNQQLFLSSKQNRLSNLHKQLYE